MDRELIRRLAQSVKQRHFEAFTSADVQSHRERLKKSDGPRLFHELEEQLETAVAAMKDELGELAGDLELASDSQGIQIRKSSEPFVKFQLGRLNYAGECVGFYFSAPHKKPVNGNDRPITLALDVAPDDTVLFSIENERLTPEQLANRVIEILFTFE
jgi:hypothetical protein